MRKAAIIIAGGALIGMIAFTAVGEDATKGERVPPSFRVIFLSRIELRSEKARIRSGVTKNKIAAVQTELAKQPFFTRKLQARGIQIRNVIRLDRLKNGHIVVYVR